MITSQRSTPVQIFILIHSAGASRQRGEILLFCDFFLIMIPWLYCIIFSGTCPGRTRGWNFTVYARIRRVFAQGRSFWGLWQYRNSFGVIAPKNSPKRGVNRQFQAKRAEYENRNTIQNPVQEGTDIQSARPTSSVACTDSKPSWTLDTDGMIVNYLPRRRNLTNQTF